MSMDWRELYASNQEKIKDALTPADPRCARAPATPRRPSRPVRVPRVRPMTGSVQAPLRALVHIPRGLGPGTPAPLVCMLHGCTQDPASFAAATRMNQAADRHGFVVVYPGQDRGANAQGCWNWFRPEHQRRGAGEPAAIAHSVLELIDANPRATIDPGRVYVAGLSSGGAMAAVLGACYPDLFAAVAVHSGLAYNSATDVASAFAVMANGGGDGQRQGRAAHAAMGARARPVASVVIHGSADRTVAAANARQVLRQSMAANHLAAPDRCDNDVTRPATSTRGHSEDGRSYTRSRWDDRHGLLMHELWEIDGLGHAWSGGAAGGSYADPLRPSATDAIWDFFVLSTIPAPRV